MILDVDTASKSARSWSFEPSPIGPCVRGCSPCPASRTSRSSEVRVKTALSPASPGKASGLWSLDRRGVGRCEKMRQECAAQAWRTRRTSESCCGLKASKSRLSNWAEWSSLKAGVSVEARVAQVVEGPEPMVGAAAIQGAGVILVTSSQYGANTLEVTRGVEKALVEIANGCTVGRYYHPTTFCSGQRISLKSPSATLEHLS